jgi:hypothetical protein
MESQNTPSAQPQRTADATMQAWLDLKHEMEQLHAHIEYVRLILRLGVHPH